MRTFTTLLICSLLGSIPLVSTQANELYLTNKTEHRFWIVKYPNNVVGDPGRGEWLESGAQTKVQNNDLARWDKQTRTYGQGNPYIEIYQDEADAVDPQLAIGTFKMRIELRNYSSALFASCYYDQNRRPTTSVNFIPGNAIGIYGWYDCRDARIENWQT